MPPIVGSMPSACLLCSVFEPILSHWKYDDGSVVVFVCYKLHFVYRMAEGSEGLLPCFRLLNRKRGVIDARSTGQSSADNSK